MKYEIRNKWVLIYDLELIIIISEFMNNVIIETLDNVQLFDTEDEMNIFIEEHHLIRNNSDSEFYQ